MQSDQYSAVEVACAVTDVSEESALMNETKFLLQGGEEGRYREGTVSVREPKETGFYIG